MSRALVKALSALPAGPQRDALESEPEATAHRVFEELSSLLTTGVAEAERGAGHGRWSHR